MAANTPTTSGLLLNDDDDAPVPLTQAPQVELPVRADSPSSAQMSAAFLIPMHEASPVDLERALAWVTSLEPTIGLRALVLFATGLNLGVSRRERELRDLFCALYRTSHDHSDPERRP